MRKIPWLILWLLSAALFAQPVPVGEGRLIPDDSAGDQVRPAVAALEDGRFVIVWQNDGPAGPGVRGRLFASDGTPRGAEIQVDGGASGAALAPDVAASGDGFVVVWDGGGTIRGQRFEAPDPCSATTLCLGDGGRFQVRVEWAALSGAGGVGRAVPLRQRDSGMFTFFGENNLEMLVKVLDGCDVNGHFWVFYAATTNLGLDVTVTDTRTGTTRAFGNVVGRPAATVTDTRAFATCPPTELPSPPAGTPIAAGGEIEIAPETSADLYRPAVAGRQDGSFVVVWGERQSPGLSDIAVRGRLFHSDGTPHGAAIAVHEDRSFDERAPDVAVTPDGGFVVVWDSAVAFRRFNAGGEPLDDLKRLKGASNSSVAVNARGEFVVASSTFDFAYVGFGGRYLSIIAEVFDRDGIAQGQPVLEPQILTTDADADLPLGTSVAPWGRDRFLVVWGSLLGGVRGQVLDDAGEPQGVVPGSGRGSGPAVATSPDAAALAWHLRSGTEREFDVAGRFYRRAPPPGVPRICIDDETLCLGEGDRFQVRVHWTVSDGRRGTGKVVDQGRRDSGTFYFFGENNLELLAKVLDGCGVNGHFWFFYAATTDLGLEVTVLDTRSGQSRTYRNLIGRPADAVTDTTAFATCP